MVPLILGAISVLPQFQLMRDLIVILLMRNGVMRSRILLFITCQSFLTDHVHILTITQPTTIKTRKRFKSENRWLLENDFHETAQQAWAFSSNKPFHVRTSNLAGYLMECRKKSLYSSS
jgi:hypothetical protein